MEIIKGLIVFLLVVTLTVAVIAFCVSRALKWNERVEKTRKVVNNGTHDKRK